jgi:lysozyme family protein
MSVETLIDEVIAREGGFVDHPQDRGGATHFGITKGTLSRWRGRVVTTADVRHLDVGEARDIYRAMYVAQPGFTDLPEPLRLQLVDFGVHSGPAQAVRALQRVLGLPVDGVLGPQTRAALAQADMATVTRRVWQERVRFLVHLVAMRPTTSTPFIDGWLNRCFAIQPA